MTCSKEPSCEQDINSQPVNKLVLNVETSEVWLAERPIVLTPIQFQLLLILARNIDRIVPKDRIYDFLWPSAEGVYAKQIADHASRIRRKFTGPSAAAWSLESIYGIGYRLTLPDGGALDVIEIDPHYMMSDGPT